MLEAEPAQFGGDKTYGIIIPFLVISIWDYRYGFFLIQGLRQLALFLEQFLLRTLIPSLCSCVCFLILVKRRECVKCHYSPLLDRLPSPPKSFAMELIAFKQSPWSIGKCSKTRQGYGVLHWGPTPISGHRINSTCDCQDLIPYFFGSE